MSISATDYLEQMKDFIEEQKEILKAIEDTKDSENLYALYEELTNLAKDMQILHENLMK